MSKILNLLICLLLASASWAQTTLHQWTFDSVSTSVGTTRPSVGNGSVSLLGGTTATFATGATAGGAGWNTSTYAAQFTASGIRGIEVVAPTTGFQNIQVSFKHRASGTASRWARVDYSLNGGAQWMTGFWNNNGGLSPHDVFYTFNVDFGTITGAANNADFRFRIVSVFSPLAFNESSAASFGADTAYMRANAAATFPPTPGGSVATYSTGGTWRFDDLTITGTALPAVPSYTLQILHASDLEAGLLAPGDAPRFASLVDTLSKTHPNTVILSSGDNVIPSPFLSASEDPSMQTPLRTAASSYYTGTQAVRAAIGRTDIMMMNLMKFNAACFGNHEFDLGTSELNGMIGVDIRSNGADKRWLGANFPYLSSNLNFSNDINLSYLVTADGQSDTVFRTSPNITLNSQKKGIARSVVIERGGEKIGVVGATTQILASISSPGATTMVGPSVNDMPALAAILQPVIDSLRIGQGINKIVLLTHLQQLSLEQALAPLLRGVDVLISGGNHSVLADNNDILRPGDVAVGTYPMIYRSADNEPILLVNTGAEYSYLGRLQVPFSSNGVVDTNALNSQINGAYATDSAGVARVWGSTAAAFANSNGMGARVKALCDAIQAVIVAKDGNLFGKSSVFLEGRRNFVRTEETNLGNVTADANLWMARKLDPAVAISIKNGGGVRSAMGEVFAVGSQVTLLPTSPNAMANKQRGDISQLDIENSLRFNNRLSVLTIPVSGIKALLEHGISAWTTTATPGQFPQVSGVRFSFDPALASGSKIKNAALVDSAGNILDTLVYNGAVYGNAARTYRVVTLNFLAGGGDSYPFAPYASTRVDLDTALASLPAGAATFTVTGSEQDAFAEYMASRFPASSPYNVAETPATADTRIQNLSLRSDGVWPPALPTYTLQILHASDLEAGLLAPGDAPRFASLVDTLSKTHPNTVILSSGDNVIPSPFLSASEDPSMQTPLRTAASSYYTGTQAVRAAIGRTDIMMMNLMKFNAACFGNHEFDLGTSELNGMIGVDIRSNGADKRWLGANFPYLSSNLNFSNDINLSYLVTADGQSDTVFRTSPNITLNSQKKGIARSVVIERGGEKIGVVGATTQILASISSPGATTMVGPSVNDMPALAAILQPVIDSLRIGQGINKIVLLTHLQQLSLEQALAPLLRGVDVLISGGNHSVLADNNDILRPGDVAVGTYPMIYRSADNEPILLVNTGAEYSYLGRLQVPFSSNGVVDTNALNSQINGAYATDSAGVARVWGSTAAAFANSNGMGARVKALCDAIQAVIVAKDGNLFGKSSVFLEGRRNFVRTEETNLGNVTADANLWMARKLDPAVAISIKNGGGVRSAMGEVFAVGSQVTLLPTSPNAMANKQRGDISQLDIENSLRFNNRLSVLTIPVSGIKALLEHGISAWTTTATPGQFPQVSGVRFSFDPALASGSKIKNAALVDSAGNILDTLVYNGAVYGNAARTYRVVTLNFLAGGGDSYPFAPYASTRVDLDTALASLPAGAATFTVTGSEQDAFAEYMASRFPASSPYNVAETPATADTRIQNLSLRSDGVLPLGPNSLRSIASIRGVNATTGVLDSLGVRVRVSGTVYGVNQYSSSSTPIGIQFVMMDATGGIMFRKAGTTFGLDSLNANGRLAEGDSVEVYGILEQFNGLTQINCDTVIRLATGRTLRNPVTVTALGESTENQLVRLNNLSIVSGTWPAAGVSSNINVTNGTSTFQMRIIAATDIDGTPAPTGPFDLVGLGGQFDNSNPFTSGYQIFPRRLSDIIPVVVQNPTASFTRGDTVLANATTSVTIPIQVLNPSSTAQVLKVRVSATPGAVYGTTFETFPAPVGDSITLNLAPNAASASISCLLYNLVAPGRTDTISFDLFAASAGITVGTVNRSVVRVFAPAIRTLTIAQIRGNDNGGLPDSLGVYARTTGIVMGFNKRPGGLEFTIFDPVSNRGLGLFRDVSRGSLGYNVREGDLLRVIGPVAHFNGLAQINLDSLVLLDSNQTLPAVEVVTALNEYTESRLVRINNLTLVNPSQWPVPGTGGSGRTVQVTNGTATYDMRIDNDVNLYGTPAPVGPFDLVGLGGQFAPSPPHTTGYQLLPRYSQDLIQVSYGQITGTLTYNNTANTPMTNSTVRVLNAQNAVVRSAATNASGAFTLDSVPHGSYTLSAFTNKPWGGVTATDALGVTRHVTGVLPLAGLRVGAADVNGSATVTSSDALLVNRRFSGSITSFSVGNWISENPSVAVSNTPATQNLKMLAYGDVNGSYVPSTSQRLEATLQLHQGTEQGVVRDGLVRLALRADRAMELGAISLELPLSAGLEVVGMEAGSAVGYSSWGRRDGMTCYGWFAEQGLRVSENDVLLTLVIKADQMNMLESLNWSNVSLGSLSEMVNPWGEVIPGSLRVDRAIKAVHSVHMFPNPAQNRVNWTWNSSQGAPSSLIVRDYTGRVVASMLPTHGSTQASLDLGQIPAGTYSVEMVWTGSNGAEQRERANLVVRP